MKEINNKDFPKIILGIILALIVLGFLIYIVFNYYQSKKQSEIVPEKPEEMTMEELFEHLTPQGAEPLSEEEQKEIDNLLKTLTPQKQDKTTAKEEQELKNLLQELTPQLNN